MSILMKRHYYVCRKRSKMVPSAGASFPGVGVHHPLSMLTCSPTQKLFKSGNLQIYGDKFMELPQGGILNHQFSFQPLIPLSQKMISNYVIVFLVTSPIPKLSSSPPKIVSFEQKMSLLCRKFQGIKELCVRNQGGDEIHIYYYFTVINECQNIATVLLYIVQ